MRWLMIMLVLAACRSSAVESSTPTTSSLIPNIEATSIRATRNAAVSTGIADARASQPAQSPLDQCALSGVGVRYVIEGSQTASLTWRNDTNGTEQGDYNLPFCRTFTGFETTDFLYISAQVLGDESITCKIYVGDRVVARAQASGFASIATCSN